MKDLIIKVCGMCDSENIRQVAELGIDWIGLIFWEKSPRHVTMIPSHAGIIPDRAALPKTGSHAPRRVGVFVDEMAQNIITRAVNFQLDYIQLHGHESPTLIRNLRATLNPDIRPGIKFIKAISVSEQKDLDACQQYEDCIDYFLFDTKSSNMGGSGRQFDWGILRSYQGTKPFLLSGGIGPDDAEAIRRFDHPRFAGIDLNSRFETEPGLKDVEKIRSFIDEIGK